MKQPIRVLQVVTIMNLGGLESFLMNIYRNIDRTKIQFDFLVHRTERGVFDDEIEKLGGKMYRFDPIRPAQFFSYQKKIALFFNNNKQYNVVHSHLNENNALVLNSAKKAGVPVRIAHSHAKATAGPYKILRELLKRNIKLHSTLNLACSEDAGRWLYGSKNFEIFKNSIDVKRFQYSSNIDYKESLRESFGIDKNVFLIGLIARFSPTKNHDFLIDVFYEYLKIDINAKLILLGDGVLKQGIENKVKNLEIESSVIFTGNVTNPEKFLTAMDLFLMTSLNEGMPVVLIEAQCSGLPILMSDTMPAEIELTNLTRRFSLDLEPHNWANQIDLLRKKHEKDERLKYGEVIKSAEYDIASNAQKLLDLYVSSFDNF